MSNFIDFENNMLINNAGLNPIKVEGQSNLYNLYYKRYLYNKLYSCFDFDFDGQLWDLNTFRYMLFHFGSVGIFYTEKFGYIFAPWTPTEYNIYMNPKRIKGVAFNNVRFFERLEGEIGIDAFIIKVFDDYKGFDDLISATSEMLANVDKTINVALMNANVNLIYYAEDKKDAEEMRTIYATATNGEPLSVIKKNKKLKLDDENKHDALVPFTNHDTVQSMDRLLTCRRTILNNFLTEIGIQNANVNKKERLVTDEVNANNAEVSANVTIAYDNIMRGLDELNERTGLNIKCDLHYDYEEENNIDINEVMEEGSENNV